MLRSGLFSRILTAFLGFAGVISSACDTTSAAPAYGPPGICFSGTVRSSIDNSPIEGIQIRAATPNSIMVAPAELTDQSGEYLIYSYEEQLYLVDSLTVRAVDIDGGENGSFADSDTSIAFTGEESEILTDFYLEPNGEEK